MGAEHCIRRTALALVTIVTFVTLVSVAAADIILVHHNGGDENIIVGMNGISFWPGLQPSGGVDTGGGGVDFGLFNTTFYDVFVTLDKEEYKPGDTIIANITLVNVGDLPDRDTILKFYLQFNETKLLLTTQQFLEVAPLDLTPQEEELLPVPVDCTYDPDVGVNCIREKKIPVTVTADEGAFVVEYFTEVQPLIVVQDSFILADGGLTALEVLLFLTGGTILIVFLLFRKKKES